MKKTALQICTLLFALCCLLAACSNPAGKEGQGETATVTINLGGSSRAAWPPTDSASISELKYVVNFSQGNSVVKTFTAQGSTVIKGSIATGAYNVTLEIYLLADSSLFAEGEAISPANPVTISQGNNTIALKANKSVSLSPESATVTRGLTQQFSASVYGVGASSFTWAVEGNNDSATNIDSTGKLTVSASESAGSLTVTARYGSSPVRKGTAKVTLTNNVNAIAPSLSALPTAAQDVNAGTAATALSVTVTNSADITSQHTNEGGGSLTYQWYRNSANSNSGGSPVSGQTSSSFTPPTSLSDAGTTYYYVIVTNTINNNGDGGTKSVSTTSNVATVTVIQDLSITVGTAAITLTPIVTTSPAYTEREATFSVTVGGFLNAADSSGVGLTIGSLSSGLSVSGNLSGDATAATSKVFNVKITYNGTEAFAGTSETISITGLSGIPYGYAYTAGNKTRTVNIFDGQTTGTAIPLKKSNIAAFNIYATDAATKAAALTKHYKLTEDILASDLRTGLAAGNNWVAIGDITDPFTGSFDGNGKTIKELAINTTSTEPQGLFGRIDNNGMVKDLGLLDVNINSTGIEVVGGIAGALGNYVPCTAKVEECYVTGTIPARYEGVGGVIGANLGGIVKNCYTTTSVAGTGSIGGVVGYNYLGTVQNCYATGNIEGRSEVGGVVGFNGSSGLVQDCVALNRQITRTTGPATYFGRVVGLNSGTLTNNNARDDMLVLGVTVGDSAENGTGYPVDNTVPLSTLFGGWSPAIWDIPGGNLDSGCALPTLRGITASQSPTLP